jgi:hypothetical protein
MIEVVELEHGFSHAFQKVVKLPMGKSNKDAEEWEDQF